ncbi:hypothetical protein FBT96_00615 [Rhodobacter capsulatus]|uniref:Uncharacterized protein n=1 Tax=Rhodobacter capsulatus TaxID=1061 RepID=A0A4U1K2X6_RHOCA|nr:hypothetical protein [Rhodobacter capsulatus]TKD26452.1 hypothetical protein FBT96_00615 [Rhodobacter capsulatus]
MTNDFGMGQFDLIPYTKKAFDFIDAIYPGQNARAIMHMRPSALAPEQPGDWEKHNDRMAAIKTAGLSIGPGEITDEAQKIWNTRHLASICAQADAAEKRAEEAERANAPSAADDRRKADDLRATANQLAAFYFGE